MRSIADDIDSMTFLPCARRAAPSKNPARKIQIKLPRRRHRISNRTIVVLRITNFGHCCIYSNAARERTECFLQSWRLPAGGEDTSSCNRNEAATSPHLDSLVKARRQRFRHGLAVQRPELIF
jgi:hypothetical protein